MNEYQARIDGLTQQLTEAKRRLLAVEVGVGAGLPYQEAKALTGTTREELLAEAQGRFHNSNLADRMREAVSQPHDLDAVVAPSRTEEPPLRSGSVSRDQPQRDQLAEKLARKVGIGSMDPRRRG